MAAPDIAGRVAGPVAAEVVGCVAGSSAMDNAGKITTAAAMATIQHAELIVMRAHDLLSGEFEAVGGGNRKRETNYTLGSTTSPFNNSTAASPNGDGT